MKSGKNIICALLLFGSVAYAQQYPILELRAQGSQRFSSDDILKASGLRLDLRKEVSLVQVRQAAERLVGSGVFAEVNYQHTELRNGMKVEFTVKDKDLDQFVPARFENFVWWPETQLIADLHTQVPLFSGQLPLGGGLPDEVAATLEFLLAARGVKGHVISQVHNAANGGPDFVDFELEDWPVRISNAGVVGASADFAAETHNATARLVGINFRRSTLDNFAENNLRNIYLAKGYLQAQFSPPVVRVLADKDAETLVEVSVPVQEGVSYRLGSVTWAGNQALPTADLQKYIRVQPGKPLDGVEFAKDITRLRATYAIKGYLHMAAAVTPAYNSASNTVSYNVLINEGDLFSMGKFNVDGLSSGSAERVRQLWKLREGEPFNREYLKEFFNAFRTPTGTGYVIEQSEGEAQNSVDVTIIFCNPRTPCQPSGPNALYSPVATDATKAAASSSPASDAEKSATVPK